MNAMNHPFCLLYVLMCITLRNHFSLGADKISANRSLSGDSTLVSTRGAFELGFFKPGNSSNCYIGIWYKKVPQQTIVWVANREKPISDIYSSELRISDGNLVLFNMSKIPIWSTNLNSTASTSVEAVLLDEGNLVLRSGSSPSELLWQSFDHPTDTWLPHSKFGINKITKTTTILTAWKNRENPSPGLFSLTLDPNQTQFILLWNVSRQFWESGPWNGHSFTSVLASESDAMFSHRFVTNKNESYFIYAPSDSIISYFVMDAGGRVRQRLWLEDAQQWNDFFSQPINPCDIYDYCGAFGSCTLNSDRLCHCLRGFDPKSIDDYNSRVYYGGCMRRTDLRCGNSSLDIRNRDRFFAIYSMVLPENAETVEAGSVPECESTCFNSCSCTAYAFESSQCQIWNGDLLNLRQIADGSPSGKTLYLKLAASEFTNTEANKGRIIVFSLISVGAFVLLGLVFMVLIRTKRRNKMQNVSEGSLVAFGYKDLQNATRNFNEKLGEGGFGSVFKGKLHDSSLIAVKMLDSIWQGEKQFRAEVRTIGTIKHVNLIGLRGFCSKGTKKLLVYEYMPNGSLSSHLFHRKNSKVLDWKIRYQIIVGAARGLAYLHEKCRECIIHCDVKPDNILLDADFCPKVADFGLAKLFGRDFSRVLTTMRGTVGYLAPEWISGVAITSKADVYSFGMMLFEVVSGKRNTDGNIRYFPLWAANLINDDGDVLSLLDPRLEGNADGEEVTRVCKIACWCIQDDETKRPSMGQVVHILEGVLDISLPPIPRLLEIIGNNNSFSSEPQLEFIGMEHKEEQVHLRP